MNRRIKLLPKSNHSWPWPIFTTASSPPLLLCFDRLLATVNKIWHSLRLVGSGYRSWAPVGRHKNYILPNWWLPAFSNSKSCVFLRNITWILQASVCPDRRGLLHNLLHRVRRPLLSLFKASAVMKKVLVFLLLYCFFICRARLKPIHPRHRDIQAQTVRLFFNCSRALSHPVSTLPCTSWIRESPSTTCPMLRHLLPIKNLNVFIPAYWFYLGKYNKLSTTLRRWQQPDIALVAGLISSLHMPGQHRIHSCFIQNVLIHSIGATIPSIVTIKYFILVAQCDTDTIVPHDYIPSILPVFKVNADLYRVRSVFQCIIDQVTKHGSDVASHHKSCPLPCIVWISTCAFFQGFAFFYLSTTSRAKEGKWSGSLFNTKCGWSNDAICNTLSICCLSWQSIVDPHIEVSISFSPLSCYFSHQFRCNWIFVNGVLNSCVIWFFLAYPLL